MKMILFLLFFPTLSQAQFTWDVKDTASRSQSQLYSNVKQFIATEWKSAQHVIQNDDKEGGVVTVKGIFKHGIYGFWTANYTYTYMATFMVKDGKYRIVLSDVYCIEATCSGTKYTNSANKIQPFDGDDCPKAGDAWLYNPSCKNQVEMMGALRSHLQSIVTDFSVAMKKDIVRSDW